MDALITYDIADTEGEGRKRLKRIAQICERYGQRVQLSVFECRLSPTRMARMMMEVRDVIDPDLDSVIVYRFPGKLSDSRLSLGRKESRELGDPWIL